MGGTGEASTLAHAVLARFGNALNLTTSLAGRTERPGQLPTRVRIGGFGGPAGLVAHLVQHGVDRLIDATHPFAARISTEARLACEEARVPRLLLLRPPWRRDPLDRWIEVDDMAAAAAVMGRIGRRAFLTVGGGWYAPGQTVKDLQDEMRRHLDAGYTMVKMKVGGLPLAEDVRRVEAVKTILPADAQLAVDANSKFGREEALAYAKALAPFRLRWFEEPCDPLDFALLAEIAGDYESPLATGENLFSTQDVENLVRFGGLRPDRNDVIQVDPPQAYGIVQYARTVAMAERHGWPRSALFPHGGNQMSLAIAGGFGLGGAESYPGVFGAFGGFADDAKLQRGYLTLSDRPGIGFEGQAALYSIMRTLAA